MRTYYRLSLQKIKHWPNKDLAKITVPLFNWDIHIPKLGGDAFSRDLKKVLKLSS